ncbi:unnamed protein product [Prorocentrum cordatum]|uniref:C3H1-type domain-containing protein n=1 Tax=Prorocentrum cordatum TaxID=2364126 RepID=A0ABN9QVJ9_9DINO|nr:unnamed protein product [Polarella glacialis]
MNCGGGATGGAREEEAGGCAVMHDGNECSKSTLVSTSTVAEVLAKLSVLRGSLANGQTAVGTDEMVGRLSQNSSSASKTALHWSSERGTRTTTSASSKHARAPKQQSLGGVTTSKESREQLSWKATFLELRDDEHQGLLSPRPSSEPCSEPSASRNEVFDADRLSTAALSKHMEEAWAANSRETMRTSLEKRRLSAAAEAIGNLPDQLNSVVQNKAKSLAESVKTDLALVLKAIRRSGGDDDVVDVAIDELGKIPEIIRSSFDSKILEANGAMRLRLSAIMQIIKSNTPESKEMVTQLWTIPEELEQITGEAVDQAVQESKREATRHCDRVLRSLPQDAGVSRRALKDAKLHIAEAVPEMYSETMRALRRTTNANVKHAVAHVDDPNTVPVTNCLIADVLLRAKAGTLPHTDGAGMPQSSYWATDIEDPSALAGEGDPAAPASVDASAMGASHQNAGSFGHPEMCVRPCLYFLRGQCTNGGACRFCHYQHPTRPVHLGRQHRKTLEAMTAVECFGISAPILERKMTMMNLATDTLKTHISQQRTGLGGATAVSRVKPRELRTLEKAFGALSMRSLLVVLQRKLGQQASIEKSCVDALLHELRGAGFLVDTGEKAHEDA